MYTLLQQQHVNSGTQLNISGSTGSEGDLSHLPVPPSLLHVQGNGAAFSVSKNDRIKREEINYLSSFLLRAGHKVMPFSSNVYQFLWR